MGVERVVWCFLTLAVLTLSGLHGQGLLVKKNELTVKVGRTVYLNRDDLVFRRPRRGDGCRVEVIQNDPITQRVGRLEPTIFDCQFLPETVRYIHSGSPFLSSDQVKLRVHRFTNSRTVSQTFYLDVNVINATTDVVVTRGLRHVIVPEFNGLSNKIDASIIRFHHSRSANVSCTVSFSRDGSQWPLVGQMVMGPQRTPIESVKKNCHEFLFMGLQYEHLRSPTPEVDYLPLSVQLHDPVTSDEIISERFFLPIYIKNALLNSSPRSSFMSMYMMDVDQFVLSTIIPGIISAEDYETPPSQLVYNISKGLEEGQGYFVSLDDLTMPIASFLQDDLENHRIAYQPPNVSFTERKIYEVEFTVFDSHFAESIPIVLHIAVRPASTGAPRVSYNTGLVLMEGQSRTISTDNLQIVDSDNLDLVRIYVAGGLECGQLLVSNRPAPYFTVDDLRNGRLKYVHDDSEMTTDEIILRINDGRNNIKVTFPIQIIPKDDSSPYIVNNLGMELNEGETQRISETMLLAHDTDSVDSNIVFSIAQPTNAGEIVRKLRISDTGTRVNKFSQRDLIKGQIYYRHFGREVFQDQFKFTLHDNQDPPNESTMETFFIIINPVNENPPQLSPEATRLLRVSETDIAFITKSELEYTDVETDANQLTYIITTPPYFVYNTGGDMSDAGKIIATHNMTMIQKDASHPAVITFKQEDINHVKIGYMPPIQDIGPEARLVRFMYTVQDSSGNKVLGQQFDIDVQPVNNQPPQFINSKLLVEEGGILGISINQLSATDEDTHSSDLVFIIDQLPSHGAIQRAGINLQERTTFTILDLRRKELRYINDGAEVLMDTITLTLTDGDNRVSKTLTIEIVPIDDEAPRVRGNLSPSLLVSEGSETIISTNALAATDEDTEDGTLVFLIIKQPKYGIMQLNGQPTTKFTQQNVKDGEVKYLHSSGEIGSHAVQDSATFIVSDQNFMATADLPILILNITLTPVDNQKPTIIAESPVIVNEGMKLTFTPDILTAKDPDTEPEAIQFVITRQPQWGFFENVKPSPGSEKSNIGIMISSFKLQDIIDQSINYVQATHKGVEPTYDSFEFYATDGTSNSVDENVDITIVPMNDEEPDVMLNDFSIQEGGSKIIDQSMVDAIDMDEPKDPITLSISQPPEHGDIVIMLHTKNGDVEASVHDFSSDELHSGMKLKYKHDNSENFRDKFAVTVSDGKHEVKRLCNITIEPMNDGRPEIAKNAGLQLQYGDHALISSVLLQAMDDDNTPDELYYILVSVPRKGALQYCLDPFSPTYASQCTGLEIGMNFTQQDITNNNIRYVHTTSMGTSETDSFLFVLTDGENKRHVETFEIRIMNSKKRVNIALLNRGLNIREGERVTLTTNELDASDESTRAEEIVFAVIRSPRLGQLEYIDRPLVSISSFTQLDMASNKIVYNHLTKTDFTVDSFTFTVTNGLSDAKDGEFIITIEPLDKTLPTLLANTLVEVLQGMEVVLTPDHLRAEDPDTASSNVTYLIAKPPIYGHLYNRGVFITNLFTQNEVDRGFITYESGESHTGLDNFLFTVSDGRHDGFLINGTLQLQPAMCSIFIKPLINDAPKLLTVNPPQDLERFGDGRYGFYLDNHHLKAVDSDTINSQLVYYLDQRPKHGHIENSVAKRYVRRRFTQMDLDEEMLQYVIDEKDQSTNDSFAFSIHDSRGNTLDGQRFELHWSVIEFAKTDLVVCENMGTLTLTLLRKGNLNTLAFVGIEVRDLSTVKDIDYIPSRAAQVQFEPGSGSATWDIEIQDDGLEENNEKFRVFLLEPVNAVLGQKKKANIRIINSVRGECPQYLGMISKHQLELPDLDIRDKSNRRRSHTLTKGKKFNSIVDPYSNTYNTDPGNADENRKGALSEISQEVSTGASPASPIGQSSKERKRRRRKGRKSRRNKKKNGKSRDRKNNKRNRGRDVELENSDRVAKVTSTEDVEDVPTSSTHILQNVDIKAPQQCTQTTSGLLYFDMNTQQMYKCNGVSWQAWSPVSSQDQQHQTQECQQGWSKFSGRCYKFVNERLTWEVAEMLCQMSYEAHLTTVSSKKHIDWLVKLAGKKSFWTGLNDREETGVWKYTNGETLRYSKWPKGGPRVKRMLHKKNCVLVNKGQYKNKICVKPKSRLVCEKGAGSDMRRSPPKRHISGGRSRQSSGRQSGFFFGQSDV